MGDRIAIDIDDTVADLFAVVPRLYSIVTGENVTRESFTNEEWDHSKVVARPEVLVKFFQPWIYQFVIPVTGAYMAIRNIRRMKHDYNIVFVTAAISGDAKIEWLKYWKFIDSHREVIITSDKSLVRADVLIDDFIGNLVGFTGDRWCYPQPWNKSFQPRGDWLKIVKWLE